MPRGIVMGRLLRLAFLDVVMRGDEALQGWGRAFFVACGRRET